MPGPLAISTVRPATTVPLARLGALQVRVATSQYDIDAALSLRYQVFCRDMGASLAGADHDRGIETDIFDPLCDHIIVEDLSAKAEGRVVGTYRALLPERAVGGFYSQSEFDIAPMIARHPEARFCEVGRSCVAGSHRSMRAIEALWCGLWAYAALNAVDVYFGAGSFIGTNPDDHALGLSYLHKAAAAPQGWQVGAHPDGAVAMDRFDVSNIDPLAAVRTMPALIRGYVRVNAHVSHTAYIDHDFGTTDVMIITRLRAMPEAYKRHFRKVTGRDLVH